MSRAPETEGVAAPPVFKYVPTNAPKWSIGIAFIIATTFTTLITLYVTVSGDVREWMKGRRELEEARERGAIEVKKEEMSVVIAISEESTKQMGLVVDFARMLAVDNARLDKELRTCRLDRGVSN